MSFRLKLSLVPIVIACATTQTPQPEPPAGDAAAPETGTAIETFDPSPWLEDLAALEQHLGRHYANLEWNRDARRLDLAELDRTTRAALTAARTDLEAIEALARFVSAFRDAHLQWSVSLPSPQYDLRLTSDGRKVAVRLAGPHPCGLKRGDEIETIGGRPALEQLAARLSLGGIANEALARDIALRTFTASPFAPRGTLHLTVRRDGGTVPCSLTPLKSVEAARIESAPLTKTTPGEMACAALGIIRNGAELPLSFRRDRHAQFRATSPRDSELASGVVRLASGRTLGWLRIPLFSVQAFPVACAEAWTQFRARVTGVCGGDCRQEFQERVLPQRLVETIVERLHGFRAANVSATVVDLTDNGGGDDWTGDVVRILSARPLKCPDAARVREPSTVESLDLKLQDLAACESMRLDHESRRALNAEKSWLQSARADATVSCDLSGLFQGQAAETSCSLLTRHRRTSCDRRAPPPGAGALPEGCTFFRATVQSVTPRTWVSSPIYVLINRRTGSAAEFVAAVLRDNGAARLIGELTAGAGCGYADGGGRITLKQSGMTILMPNCVRFRVDETNEVDGVKPDVVVPWTVDDLQQFDSYAEKILVNADALFRPQPSQSGSARETSRPQSSPNVRSAVIP